MMVVLTFAERAAEAHVRAWNHSSWVSLPGAGVECREPGCGWGISQKVIDQRERRRVRER